MQTKLVIQSGLELRSDWIRIEVIEQPDFRIGLDWEWLDPKQPNCKWALLYFLFMIGLNWFFFKKTQPLESYEPMIQLPS